MKGYELSEEALADLQKIWAYIARDNPDAADKLEANIYRGMSITGQESTVGSSTS